MWMAPASVLPETVTLPLGGDPACLGGVLQGPDHLRVGDDGEVHHFDGSAPAQHGAGGLFALWLVTGVTSTEMP